MWITIAKAVSELACMVGSEVIVSGIVKNSLNGTNNKILKGCGQVASFFVAGVMGVAAANYADETIDEAAETVTKAINGIRKAGEENAE